MRGKEGIEFLIEEFEKVEVIKIGKKEIDEREEKVKERGKNDEDKEGKRGREKVKKFVELLIGKGKKIGEKRINKEIVKIGNVENKVESDIIIVGKEKYIGERKDLEVFIKKGNIEKI